MNDNLTPSPAPPPEKIGKFKFLLIALGPMPIVLLIFTSQVFLHSDLNGPQTARLAIFLGILTLLCCAIGSIGMCGGFGKGYRPTAWIGGIALGIVLFVVEVIMMFFLGCAIIMHGK